jgi:hypothetical protein
VINQKTLSPLNQESSPKLSHMKPAYTQVKIVRSVFLTSCQVRFLTRSPLLYLLKIPALTNLRLLDLMTPHHLSCLRKRIILYLSIKTYKLKNKAPMIKKNKMNLLRLSANRNLWLRFSTGNASHKLLSATAKEGTRCASTVATDITSI